MTFGFGQFAKIRKQKVSDNTVVFPGAAAFLPAIGGGSTTTTPGNGYTYQTFTGSGTLVVSAPLNVDMLLVAGGGAGGNAGPQYGGGGGAGGLVYFPNYSLSAGTYTIEVGAGAADFNADGNLTSIRTPPGAYVGLATGGGSGGGRDGPTMVDASLGGSGGGGRPPSPVGGTGVQPLVPNPGSLQFGNPGGGGGGPSAAGGGGGAGGAGTGGVPGVGGAGGTGRDVSGFSGPLIGVPGLSPLAGRYAGGGGGGGSPAAGGAVDGGGAGDSHPGPAGGAGLARSGGGGGGASPGNGVGRAGGSGIFVIRYLV